MNETNLSPDEEQIQDTSEQLATILESLPVAVCRLTADGSHDVLSITAGIVRLSGFSGKDFLAKPSLWRERIHPDDQVRVSEILAGLVRNGCQQQRYRYRWRHLDGSWRWFSDCIRLKCHPDGSQSYLVGTIQDSTDRIRNEKIIQRDREWLASRVKVSQYRSDSIEKLLIYALDETIRLTDSTEGYVYLYDEKTEEFILTAWSQCGLMEGAGVLPRWSVDEQELLVTFQESGDTKRQGRPDKLLSVPVFDGEQIVALFVVANKEATYDRTDINQFIILVNAVWKMVEQQRAEEMVRKSLYEKEMLLKEVNHRVKNNLAVVASLLHLQSSQVKDPRDADLFRVAESRVKVMISIHEMLYRSIALDTVLAGEFFTRIANQLIRAYDRRTTIIRVECGDLSLGLNSIIPCGLIINELVSNALKHAFPDARTGIIDIGFVREDPGFVTLTVRDNGVGLPEEPQQTDSLGLVLVDSLATQLDGTLTMSRDGGACFTIRFPEESKET